MLKLSALIGPLAFFCGSWFSGFSVPRLVQGPGDYLLIEINWSHADLHVVGDRRPGGSGSTSVPS